MENIVDLVLEQERLGNVMVMGIEGPMSMNLDDFIDQPTEGILYDLNRSREVVLTFIDNPKWVNDYAVMLVITRLKQKLEDGKL